MSTSSLAIPLPVPSKITRGRRNEQVDHSDSHIKKLAGPMDEANQKTDGPPDNRDEFQQIRGIGQAIEQALYKVGIYRYADLADFTPDRLAEMLKAKISSISPQRIERDDWPGQARALAFSQEKPQPQNTEKNKSIAEQPEQNIKNAPKENWRELGDFFVSFGYMVDKEGNERLQTKVHYSQADKSEHWDGLATAELLNWILDQANLSSLMDTEAQGIRAAPAEKPYPQLVTEETSLLDLFLDLSDLWVTEVKVPVSTGEQSHARRMRANCRLSLSGPAATELSIDRASFAIKLYLVNIQTNESDLVASYPGQLIPNELTYEIQQDFSIPPIGRYQLYLVAMLLPLDMAVTHLQGPIIRVEA